jgi:predicted ABC-class ATPase
MTVLWVAVCLQEALELGASVLLMDEDTCATNFMMRDARMAALVAPHKEPITPFSSRIA